MVAADSTNSTTPNRNELAPMDTASRRQGGREPVRQPAAAYGGEKTRPAPADHLRQPANGSVHAAHHAGLPPEFVRCQTCPARHRGVCGALSDQQLMRMAGRVTRRRIEAGRTLQADGEEPVACASLLSGVVKLTKTLADGRQQIVGLQFPPEFIGRPDGGQSHLSAEAVTDLEVCSIPHAVLLDMIKSHPALEHRLFEETLAQLDQARDWLLAIGREMARERVAALVHLIASRMNTSASGDNAVSGEQTFDLPLSRAEMADFLGLTIETVSRQITRLRQAGLISLTNNRHVTVHDMQRLLEAAGGWSPVGTGQ